MKRIVVELSNERLITPGGLTLVGGALGKSDLVKRSNRMTVDKKRSQPQIKNGDILLTYIGLLCQGKTSFDSVREFHADPDYFKAALGISYAILSSETLRQRMDMIGRSLRKDILQARDRRKKRKIYGRRNFLQDVHKTIIQNIGAKRNPTPQD